MISPKAGPTLGPNGFVALKKFWLTVCTVVTSIVVKFMIGVELCRVEAGKTVEFESKMSGRVKDETKFNKKSATFWKNKKLFEIFYI